MQHVIQHTDCNGNQHAPIGPFRDAGRAFQYAKRLCEMTARKLNDGFREIGPDGEWADWRCDDQEEGVVRLCNDNDDCDYGGCEVQRASWAVVLLVAPPAEEQTADLIAHHRAENAR